MNITLRLRKMGMTPEQYHAQVKPLDRMALVTIKK